MFLNVLLCFDKDGRVDGIQNAFTDELLSDRYCTVIRYTQIRKIIEKSRVPALHVLLHEPDEGLDLGRLDVLLQQLPVVVQQRRDRVLGQDVVADLFLHESEMFSDVFLKHKIDYLIKNTK